MKEQRFSARMRKSAGWGESQSALFSCRGMRCQLCCKSMILKMKKMEKFKKTIVYGSVNLSD